MAAEEGVLGAMSIEEAEAATGISLEEYLELQDRFERVAANGPLVEDSEGTVEDWSTKYRFRDRTANPNPEKFDSIAAVWYSRGSSFLPVVNRGCTANYIGGKFWLTAAHCVDRAMPAFLEQSDGQKAGVENVYRTSDNVDLALIKVGTGISATPLKLADAYPKKDEVLDVVGYAWYNNFSSRSTVKVLDNEISTHLDNGKVYVDQFRAGHVAPLDYSTEPGDSGSAAFSKNGNTVYGVLTGGTPKEDGYAAVAPHISWINSTMKLKGGSSLEERLRAFKGGASANIYVRETTIFNDIRAAVTGFSSR